MKFIKMYESFSGMSGGDLKMSIEEAMQNPAGSPPIAVIGHPRIGKTRMIGQIVDENGGSMIYIDCEKSDISDFIAPRISNRRTEMTQEQILPNDNGYNGKGGVIVFDEVDRCTSSEVEMLAYELATKRSFDGYTLPDKWVVILNDHHGSSAYDGRFTIVNV
jgi:hypothetical protein